MKAGNHELEFNPIGFFGNNRFRQISNVWELAINFSFRVLREYSYAVRWCCNGPRFVAELLIERLIRGTEVNIQKNFLQRSAAAQTT